MTDTWNNLTSQHGRKAVMSLKLSDQQLDTETARQIPILREAIRPFLNGTEKIALDFGCGYGRFTPMLANLIDGRAVGFDPSSAMVASAQWHTDVDYISCPTDQFFHETTQTGTHYDLILAYAVLGEPSMGNVAPALSRILSPGGLLTIVEHVVPDPDPERWWRFQRPGHYETLFGACGITLRTVGTVAQLEDVMTIYAGRLHPAG